MAEGPQTSVQVHLFGLPICSQQVDQRAGLVVFSHMAEEAQTPVQVQLFALPICSQHVKQRAGLIVLVAYGGRVSRPRSKRSCLLLLPLISVWGSAIAERLLTPILRLDLVYCHLSPALGFRTSSQPWTSTLP
jgi:hypothetical protein